jgi:hypothetical protein
LGIDQFGMGGLQRLVAAAQRVEFGIGNRRRGFAVIAPVVLGDFRAEFCVFGARGVEGGLFGRRGGDRSRSWQSGFSLLPLAGEGVARRGLTP